MDNIHDQHGDNAPLSRPNEATSGGQPATSAPQNPKPAQPAHNGDAHPSPTQGSNAQPSGNNRTASGRPIVVLPPLLPRKPRSHFTAPNLFSIQNGYTGGTMGDMNRSSHADMANYRQAPFRTPMNPMMSTAAPPGHSNNGGPISPAGDGNQGFMSSNTPPGPNENGRHQVGGHEVMGVPSSGGQWGPVFSSSTGCSAYSANAQSDPGSAYAPPVSGPVAFPQNPGWLNSDPVPVYVSAATVVPYEFVTTVVKGSLYQNGEMTPPEEWILLPGNQQMRLTAFPDYVKMKLAWGSQ